MVKYLKYLLFVLIVLLTPKVFAQEFNVSSSDLSCPLTSGSGKYCGVEVYYTGTSAAYTLGTRYNGRLNRIWFNLSAGGYADANGFEKGHTYTVTMNMATNDWNNKFGSLSVKCEGSSGTELKKGSVTYISYKKIKFTFQAPSNEWCQFVYVDINASSGNTITQVSNWDLSSLTISDSAYDSGSSGGTSPTPTPDSSQAIINNQNQNTTQIIDNQNQNTSDIIENANENTDKIIDSMSSDCPNLINLRSLNLFRSGERTYSYVFSESLSAGTYTMTYDYYSVFSPEVQVQVYLQGVSGTTKSYVLSNSGKLTFTMPNAFNRMYFYITNESDLDSNVLLENFMLVNGSSSVSYCEYGSKLSKIDETTNAINNLNDSINNDNIDDKTGFFTNFQDNNHGLTGIITAPLATIQGLANTSCSPLSIPIPYTNSNVTLPCMTEVYQTYVPIVFNLWQVVSFGIISYFICIDIFKMVKGFKDPNEDKVEVLDL